ncbi:dTMP kinase [Chloroflexota bacterium]
MKRRDKPIFICFVGIDGAGKTTQAKKLSEMLQKRGIRSEYIWNKFEPRLAAPFLKIAKLLFFRRRSIFGNYTEHVRTKRRLLANPVVSTVYQYLWLIDYLSQIFFKTRMPLIRGKSIVCDRYIYDPIVDLTVDLDYSEKKVAEMLRKTLLLFPKPDMVFLIDLPEEIAYQRKDDVPSLDYLKERRKVYLNIAKDGKMILVDGCGDPAELQSIIWDKVGDIIK